MFEEIIKYLENFRMIEEQAIDIYSKTVQDIIVSKSEDKKLIEHIFDGMLGFCYDEDMLKLFKKLWMILYSGLIKMKLATWYRKMRYLRNNHCVEAMCKKCTLLLVFDT